MANFYLLFNAVILSEPKNTLTFSSWKLDCSSFTISDNVNVAINYCNLCSKIAII